MKKEITMIIYGVLLSVLSFLMILSGFNNEPSVIKVVLIILPLVVVPLSLFAHSIYMVILDRKKYTPYFIVLGTYNILVLSSIFILIIWMTVR